MYAEIPNLENRNKETIKNDIVNTYIRSMNKWDIPFQDLLENRSGAACVNWSNLTEDFLKTGMFDALGYSQNIPNKKASQIAAVSGCEKMKEYYKLENTCTCEVILTNEINEEKTDFVKKNIETLSPAVRKIVVENKIDIEKVKGSGKEGRILKGD